jgi:hypothetical protein
MAKVITKTYRVEELPPSMVAELDVAPDELVRVTVDARRRRDVQALFEITRRASREARRRGLTKEKLAELLDEH